MTNSRFKFIFIFVTNGSCLCEKWNCKCRCFISFSILAGYLRRCPPGANMMLRELGIILFLACVGLSSGTNFVSTITQGGYIWMLYGAAITFIPIIIISIIARLMKLNYLKICGIISGSMTDPPALEYANSLAPVQAQSTSYATVYPLTMFLRILSAQILILATL